MDDATSIDLELALPLALIRSHTKTDDVPSVTDAQLVLYRQAAFEAAEQYTGLIFSRSGYVTQSMARPLPGLGGPRMQEMVSPWGAFGRPIANARRRSAPVKLLAPAADGVIVITHQGKSQTIIVAPGATSVDVPWLIETADGCSDPCGAGGPQLNFGVVARYRIGVCDAAAIPAGIKIGCLKLIAWNIENPGDRLEVVHDSGRSSSTGMIGTNNATWASGAIEQWRQYRPSLSR